MLFDLERGGTGSDTMSGKLHTVFFTCVLLLQTNLISLTLKVIFPRPSNTCVRYLCLTCRGVMDKLATTKVKITGKV